MTGTIHRYFVGFRLQPAENKGRIVMSEELRELARNNPDAVRSVAEKAVGPIEKRLRDILEEEHGNAGELLGD